MSAQPEARTYPGESIAGLLAACSIFASFVAIAYRPGRLIPAAVIVALIASAIGGRHSRLAAFAIATAAVCFLVGMAVAVITSNPVF